MLRSLKNWFIRIEEEPIIILGNQKSGTSAITHLLADCSGFSKTVDIPPSWPPYAQKLITGEEKLQDLVKKHPIYFSRKVIKEPNLTFVSEQVLEQFPQGKFIFIVRDPRSNIRSLLNRKNIPGNLSHLGNYEEEVYNMGSILCDEDLWGGKNENYIGVMSYRWKLAIDNFLKNKDKFYLVRYEDFVKNKKGYIEKMAYDLHLPVLQDIGKKVNLQYQPKGNSNINFLEFFGKSNLEVIKRICEKSMVEIGYRFSFFITMFFAF